jgi:hypothetical protein
MPGTSYGFGGWFKNRPDRFFHCTAYVWSGQGCTGQVLAAPGIEGDETSWTYKSVVVDVPASGTSIGVNCDSTGTLMDKLFLTPDSGGF